MVSTSIQDRTNEFRTILTQAQKRQASTKTGAQRQSLLSDAQKQEANGHAVDGRKPTRSEFARNAAQVGRSISATMGKLERLAQRKYTVFGIGFLLISSVARRKTIFDDRPVEIAELTYIIKQDLASINSQISSLKSLTESQHPNSTRTADQEGQHNQSVVLMLQTKLGSVGMNFKDVLETRTKNIQASKSRTDQFVSSVSARSTSALEQNRSESPLYQGGISRNRTPHSASQTDLLTLEPSSTSTLSRMGPQSDHQLLMMEEAQPVNAYIQERGNAIESIERTINDLGSVFGQLAAMVSEQGEQLQRIDANTEDVVDNVEGAQRELLKYWNRVSGNRWLIAKMFGVLMVSLTLEFISNMMFDQPLTFICADLLPSMGPDLRLESRLLYIIFSHSKTSRLAVWPDTPYQIRPLIPVAIG